MGVQGLWSILYCCSKDIDLKSLEGKVLAIDLSIWLNQSLKSANDSPNAHLQILFNRICKLLFYKIKPVFVFDGPTPSIKKYAMEMRRKSRQLKYDRTEEIRTNIINILMKRNLVGRTQISTKKAKESNDIFQLNNEKIENIQTFIESEHEDIAIDYISNFDSIDDVDIESDTFHMLPLEVQYEVLRTVSKEKLYGSVKYQKCYNELNYNDFSNLQIKRLLDRNKIQQKVVNLRSAMNYRECRNILDSSNLKCFGDLSHSSVSAKKIMSKDDGYLMLIDSSNNDLVKSLSKSKKEAMLKDTKRKIVEENNEDINEKESNYSVDESESVLNEQDMFNLMKCVSKLKKNIIEEDIINDISNVVNSEGQYEENQLSSSNLDSISSDLIENIESVENEIEIKIPMPEIFDHYSSKPPDENVLNEDESECDDDFVEVSDIEEIGFEESKIIYYEKEKEVSDNEIKYLFPLNETNLFTKQNSTNDPYFSETDIRDINTDPQSWLSSINSSLIKLSNEEQKLEHQSLSMSSHYFQEAKELLKLFGIPFVESPAEAEAQCAFLESIGMTDGTITEDSDIWLFGGEVAYKHMFTNGFSLKEYKSDYIFKKLGLDRDLMICIALLSGCDYTPGIYGVGPVNAIEILAEFSDLDKPMTNFEILKLFKNWSEDNKRSLNYSGNRSRKRFLRFQLEKNFPDSNVYEAFKKPLVDESKEPFEWSSPSTDKLIEFLHLKIGWSKLKIIEMLEVALRTNSETSQCQKKITDYFNDSINSFSKLPSKRLKQAAEQRNIIMNSCNTYL